MRAAVFAVACWAIAGCARRIQSQCDDLRELYLQNWQQFRGRASTAERSKTFAALLLAHNPAFRQSGAGGSDCSSLRIGAETRKAADMSANSIHRRALLHTAIAGYAFGAAVVAPPAHAVSGGGKDFSGTSIEKQDFSGQQLSGKEFRGVRGAGANFKGADLTGTSFFKADLNGVIFADADLTGASLEDADLVDVSFDNSILSSSYFTRTIEDAKSITGADFSEAIMPEKTMQELCKREDAKGVNPKTQVATRGSLMCVD